MKKIIVAPLVLLFSLSLVACSPDSNDNSVVGETSAESSSSSTSIITSAASPTIKSEEGPSVSVNNDEYDEALAVAHERSMAEILSYDGLYDSLIIMYGFSPEAAKYAVDNVGADWYQNAIDLSVFYHVALEQSKEEVYDELISDVLKFTPEQAQYAVDNLDTVMSNSDLSTYEDYDYSPEAIISDYE